MTEGRAAVRKSMKELMMHWAEARSQWSDTNAHGFEERFMTPFGLNAKKAIGGMDQMAQVLQKIKQECGE
jgi:hypothetical protein